MDINEIRKLLKANGIKYATREYTPSKSVFKMELYEWDSVIGGGIFVRTRRTNSGLDLLDYETEEKLGTVINSPKFSSYVGILCDIRYYDSYNKKEGDYTEELSQFQKVLLIQADEIPTEVKNLIETLNRNSSSSGCLFTFLSFLAVGLAILKEI